MVGKPEKPSQPWTARQKRWTALGGVAVVVLVVVASVLSASHPGKYGRSGHGCVTVQIAGATGGELLHQCGAAAAAWCQTVFAQHTPLALLVQPQCRLAGYSAPSASPAPSPSGSPG